MVQGLNRVVTNMSSCNVYLIEYTDDVTTFMEEDLREDHD